MRLFRNTNFIWSIFDDFDDEPPEDFTIKEIRCCDCFIDKIQHFIERNNEVKFKKLYNEIYFIARNLTTVDVYLYFSTTAIFCCESILKLYSKLDLIDKDEMDKNCLAEEIDFCCLYYLSRETIFNCICDNCQKTLLKLVSEKFIAIKIKK